MFALKIKDADFKYWHLLFCYLSFAALVTLVTTITANAGIKPIMLPNIDIDDQDIYRIDGSKPF